MATQKVYFPTKAEAFMMNGQAPDFAVETAYSVDHIVRYEGALYRCRVAVTAANTTTPDADIWDYDDTTTPPTVTGHWEKLKLSTDCLTSIKFTASDGDLTMAEVLARLNTINAQGQHLFFDVSQISSIPQLYLVIIYIDSTANVVRIYDQVTGKIYTGPYVSTDTLAATLAKAVDAYVYITVTAVTLDGVTVTGQTVTLREGQSATSPVRETKTYSGTPVTFVVPRGMEYYVEVTDTLADHFGVKCTSQANPYGMANSNVEMTFTYYDPAHIDTVAICESATPFTDLKDTLLLFGSNVEAARSALVYQGTNDQTGKLIGILIPDTWTATNGTTVYDDPIMCVDVKMYEDENGVQHLGAKLQRVYACAEAVAFDAAETVVQCDSTTEAVVEENMGYYGWAPVYDATKAYAVNDYCSYGGAAYKCTTAIASGGEAWNPDHWTAQTSVVKSALVLLNPWNGTGLADGDTLPYSDYLSIHKNTLKDSSKNIFSYGYNNWAESGNRQYYNSEAGVNAWWTAQHVGDVAPGKLTTVRGYMAGLSANLKLALSDGNGGYKKVKIESGKNSITDRDVASVTYDTIFLSSRTEEYGTAMTNDGTADAYWKMAADKALAPSTSSPNDNNATLNALRVTRSVTNKTGSSVTVRLRSASRGNSCYTWYVSASGSLSDGNSAGYEGAGAPACVIYN